MAPKKTLTIVSNIKAVFGKSKSKQQTSKVTEDDSGFASLSQTPTEAPSLASQDTIEARSVAEKEVGSGVTELFPAVMEPTLPNEGHTTKSVTVFTRPCDIMKKHSALLPTCGPQLALINLPVELSKTGTFTSPLPINLATAALTRGHFRCPEKHVRLRKSKNVYAPTLCTTCHKGGDAMFAQCKCCNLRMCKDCARLLSKAENTLEGLLEELVRLGVWQGLQGQG